jgi:hypothetical protein
MKRLILTVMVCFVGALAPAARAQSNQVCFSYSDFGQTPQTVRKLYLYPLYVPSTSPMGMTTLDRRVYLTDMHGLATATNMLAGLYRGEFQGVWQATTNWFTIPATNGLIYASNCVASAYVLAGSQIPAYSMTQADARFASIWAMGGGLTLIPGTGLGVSISGMNALLFTTNIPPSALPGSLGDWARMPTNAVTAAGITNGQSGVTLVDPTVTESLMLSKVVDDATVESEIYIDDDGNLIVSSDQGMFVGSLGQNYIHGAPVGNGSSMTNLNASALATGTVPLARLINIGPANLQTTNAPHAGYYLRVDSTGTNLYYSPN